MYILIIYINKLEINIISYTLFNFNHCQLYTHYTQLTLLVCVLGDAILKDGATSLVQLLWSLDPVGYGMSRLV